MKCIEVSNVNYDQFERLAKQYEMSIPQFMGSIISFFKHLPISPIEVELVYSMIRFFNETGINPLEPGEDLSLVMMKRVLAELKEVSTSVVHHNGYANSRQEYKLEVLELQTKAIKLAVENITYLIRLQDKAAAKATPQPDSQQLVRDLLTAFSSSKSVSVLVGDDPVDTLTSRSIEMTRTHLQAAYTLYNQELPAKHWLFGWFTRRNDAQERAQIIELARQIHENEAKQVLAGRMQEVYVPSPEHPLDWLTQSEIPAVEEITDEDHVFYTDDKTNGDNPAPVYLDLILDDEMPFLAIGSTGSVQADATNK